MEIPFNHNSDYFSDKQDQLGGYMDISYITSQSYYNPLVLYKAII